MANIIFICMSNERYEFNGIDEFCTVVSAVLIVIKMIEFRA